MKNIFVALFIFLFTLGIAFYNFYRKAYTFGWIAVVFAVVDFAILAYAMIRFIRKK